LSAGRARVLKPAGVLFIYDLAANDSAQLIAALGYKAHAEDHVQMILGLHGLVGEVCLVPETSVDGFFDVLDRETYAAVFAGVRPILYRFVKQDD
jgi:hypothetical protein